MYCNRNCRRLTAIKNQELFLRSVKEVTKKNSKKPLKVFLIGDGEDKEKLQNLCEDLNMPFLKVTLRKKKFLSTLHHGDKTWKGFMQD